MCKWPLHRPQNYVDRTWERSAYYSARNFQSCFCPKPKCNLMYRSNPKSPIPPPPPPSGKTSGREHLTFPKNVGQIPRYVASLDGQMPHPLELQRGSNPPPSRKNRIAYLLEIRGGGGTPREIGCGCAAPLPKPLPYL